MTVTIKAIYVIITGILLVIALAHSQANKMDKSCANIQCSKPPSHLKCKQISETNNKPAAAAFLKSKEKSSVKCCPLWECRENNKKGGKPEFRTFHGQKGNGKLAGGGTETVRYQSTHSKKKGKPVYNVVSSVATGNHDANAVAINSKSKKKNVTKEMEDSFKNYGL